MRLVADVGGTNTRIGLAHNGNLLSTTVRSYRNDDFPCFSAVVNAYRSSSGDVRVEEIAIAVAGPVSNGRARLTNRDWNFDATDLSERYGKVPACLLNDLNALGYASPFLDPACLDPIISSDGQCSETGQSLIVGIGTGFNVSPVAKTAERVVCLSVEFGHVDLPLTVADMLFDRFGAPASHFKTIEDVFSGRGFAAISELFLGEQAQKAQKAGPSSSLQQLEFHCFYAQLLGFLSRNLMLAFLPTSGIFFAGGVARNLLSTPARKSFVSVFERPFELDQRLSASVFSVLDDAAALKGCSKYPISE